MAKIEFNANDRPTLGVEIELGLIDGRTMALSSAFDQVAKLVPEDLADSLKPELMQCVVEIITGVCETVDDAEADLREKIIAVEAATDQLGMRLWWGATHPFSPWQEQMVTNNDRYLKLVQLLQELARRLVTFGLHIHVGVDSGDKAVMICDRILRHLPTLLALSSSSPFWEGRQTGLQSYRSKIMEGLPTAGLPTLMRNWSEYVWLVHHMVETGFINTIREIWWDVRPHHNFGTVEVRVCDMPGSLDDTMAIAALVQCLVKTLSDEIDNGTYQHDCHPMMVRQNKWRAARYGTAAQLVDSFTYQVVTVEQSVNQLVDHLTPMANQLHCEHHLKRCLQIAASPSCADRQLSIQAETGSAEEVVRQLTELSRVSPPE
ncbi:Carboxylate-amine ligase YbdK [Bythopirellula polymerisocia]|uniref:Putative glutamate--cysteine ligase 2 n=2 Tax=Bythopirellula polymerisocia TaxID=2528003 RepID=A0A5C6CMI2_9BACT|nr:Carboxylate-amine ligase YbdK [Bythopirellula polymerisocia]